MPVCVCVCMHLPAAVNLKPPSIVILAFPRTGMFLHRSPRKAVAAKCSISFADQTCQTTVSLSLSASASLSPAISVSLFPSVSLRLSLSVRVCVRTRTRACAFLAHIDAKLYVWTPRFFRKSSASVQSIFTQRHARAHFFTCVRASLSMRVRTGKHLRRRTCAQ